MVENIISTKGETMKKKITALVLSMLMLLSFSGTAMAATTYNEYEKAVIAVFEEGLDVRGVHLQINPEYIQLARQAMIADDVDMTAEQSNRIVAIIRKAYSLAQEDGGLTVWTLKHSTRSAILELIKEAAQVVGYTGEYDASTKNIIFKDTHGNIIFDRLAADVIKNTGDSYQGTAAAIGALAVVMVGAGIVAKKKKFFKVA